MSYILDALRKADAERARGSVPGIHAQATFAGTAASPPARQGGLPQWLVLIGVGALVVAAAAGLWLVFGSARPGVPVVGQAPAAALPAPTPVTAQAPLPPTGLVTAPPVTQATPVAPVAPVVAPFATVVVPVTSVRRSDQPRSTTCVSSTLALAMPKPARAMRWSWRSRACAGSLTAACANSSCDGSKRLTGWLLRPVDVRKKVNWKPHPAAASRSAPVAYHHSVRNPGWAP